MNDKTKIFITLVIVLVILGIWVGYTFASVLGLVPAITEI
jgi:CHASE3 domain sensor protein